MTKLILFLLAVSTSAFATDFSKVECPSDEILASEVIRAELMGWRNSFVAGECLKQEDFKYFGVGDGLGYDDKNVVDSLRIDKIADVKVKKVQRNQEGQTEVSFEILANGKKIQDSFSYERSPSNTRFRAENGCLRMFREPKAFFVLKSCK